MKNKTETKRFLPLLTLMFAAFIFVQCDDRDKYYERPAWLESPIYEVLKADGKFGKYLQAVDRTSYAQVLHGAGLYTVFAPNDEAFAAYLSSKGYNSVADIPDAEVDKIVAYSICYSTCVFDSLGAGGAFKYKTQYYAKPYRDPEYNNEWVVDQTAENTWSRSYNNYKFVPAFTSTFFNSYSPVLTASDYNVFFPNVTWTGKNIQDGEVLRKDMRAENGIIHEVSTVNLPLDNIADILNRPENINFKTLVDTKDMDGKYLFREYLDIKAQSPTLLQILQKMMPHESIDNIYAKFYTGLSYSLNLENVLDEGSGYIPEKAGYTMMLPANDVLTEYLDNRVLKYYKTSKEPVPTAIIQTLIDAHLVPALVWRASYATATNGNGDYLNGKGSGGLQFDQAPITKSTFASNGFVYNTSEVVRSRIFESVYSEIFLNPAHRWLEAGYAGNFRTSLREDLQKCVLNGYTSERYTLIVFDDKLLEDDKFVFNNITSVFTHSVTDVNAVNRLTRLIREHVFPGLNNSEVNSEITDFATTGISQEDNWNFTVNLYGDPVRYKDNKIQAAGNIEDDTYVNLEKINDTYLNGTVWKADRMLEYSPRVTGASDAAKFADLTLWDYLDRARTDNPNVKLFVDYLQKCIKTLPDDAASKALDGINSSAFYTVLMPNTAAMNSAISAGVLPPIEQVLPSNPEAFAKAAFFINSHIIGGRVFMDDNIRGYLYPANAMELNKALAPVQAKVNNEKLGLTNQALFIAISKNASGLLNWEPQSVTLGSQTLVKGEASGTVRVQRGKPAGSTKVNNYRSNRIACRAVLHEVNNYIKFTLVE